MYYVDNTLSHFTLGWKQKNRKRKTSTKKKYDTCNYIFRGWWKSFPERISLNRLCPCIEKFIAKVLNFICTSWIVEINFSGYWKEFRRVEYANFLDFGNNLHCRKIIRGDLGRKKFQRTISHNILTVRQLDKKNASLDKSSPGKRKSHLMETLVPRSKSDERTSK